MKKISTIGLLHARYDYDDKFKIFGCFLIIPFARMEEINYYDDYILENYTGVHPDLMMKMIVI